MNTLSLPARGLIWTALFFVLCLVVVHIAKLVVAGYRSLGKKAAPPKEERKPEKEPEKKPEPVYYIVEKKKKKRAKTEYEPPKEISFR